MQSLPSPRTLRHFITNSKEYYPQSQTMDHHNKAAGFEKRLNAYILENYRLNIFSMDEYSIQSQRMQADAIGEAFRGWRRLWQGEGKEYTSGALVWQVSTPVLGWLMGS
jgi:beta-mannosidase